MKHVGGRPSKQEIVERREKVKDLYLKGKTIGAISKALEVSYPTIEGDVHHIQAYYTKLVINNPYLAEKQFAKVEQLLDEVNLIKNEYWDVYKELQAKVEEHKHIMANWEKSVEQAKAALKEAETTNDSILIRKARKTVDFIDRPPRLSNLINSRIDTLKAILDRVDKESKLLGLFNPQQLIDKNYISVEVMRSVMEIFKGIIMDLIPEDKRDYAFRRLRVVDIQALKAEDIVEGTIMEKNPEDINKPMEKITEEQAKELNGPLPPSPSEEMPKLEEPINLDDVSL